MPRRDGPRVTSGAIVITESEHAELINLLAIAVGITRPLM